MLEGERLAVLERRGHPLRRELAIVRVDQLHVRLERQRLGSALQAEDPVELVRPRDGVVADVPLPAADVGERLRLGEGFASPPPLGERSARTMSKPTTTTANAGGRAAPARSRSPRRGVRPPRPTCRSPTRNAEVAAPTCLKRRPEEEREDQVRVAPGAREEDERAGHDEAATTAAPSSRCARVGGVPLARSRTSRIGATTRIPIASPNHHRSQATAYESPRVREREHGDAVRGADRRADEALPTTSARTERRGRVRA